MASVARELCRGWRSAPFSLSRSLCATKGALPRLWPSPCGLGLRAPERAWPRPASPRLASPGASPGTAESQRVFLWASPGGRGQQGLAGAPDDRTHTWVARSRGHAAPRLQADQEKLLAGYKDLQGTHITHAALPMLWPPALRVYMMQNFNKVTRKCDKNQAPWPSHSFWPPPSP